MAIDKRALARDLMAWAAMKERLDELEAAIKDTVLQLGETFTVGDVRASYSGGRKTYDYAGAITSYNKTNLIAGALFARHAKTTYDYRAMCDELGIEASCTKSDPSVTLKII